MASSYEVLSETDMKYRPLKHMTARGKWKTSSNLAMYYETHRRDRKGCWRNRESNLWGALIGSLLVLLSNALCMTLAGYTPLSRKGVGVLTVILLVLPTMYYVRKISMRKRETLFAEWLVRAFIVQFISVFFLTFVAVNYRTILRGRSYNNVSVTANASQVPRPSIILFDGNAAVYPELGGFATLRGAADEYVCAAPILQGDAEISTTGPPIRPTFWAVSQRCCGPRVPSFFNCPEWRKPLHGGLVMSESGRTRSSMLTAMTVAARLPQLEAVESPVLVTWMENPHEYAESLRTTIIATLIITPTLWAPLYVLTARAFNRCRFTLC